MAPQPPTPDRLAEIRAAYENRRHSRSGKERLWAIIGELLVWQGRTLEIHTMIPVSESGDIVGKPPYSVVISETERPARPPTPTQREWKAVTRDEQSAHFAAIQAWEASLTPAEIAEIVAADQQLDADRRERDAEWKAQFAGDKPYVKPAA